MYQTPKSKCDIYRQREPTTLSSVTGSTKNNLSVSRYPQNEICAVPQTTILAISSAHYAKFTRCQADGHDIQLTKNLRRINIQKRLKRTDSQRLCLAKLNSDLLELLVIKQQVLWVLGNMRPRRCERRTLFSRLSSLAFLGCVPISWPRTERRPHNSSKQALREVFLRPSLAEGSRVLPPLIK